MSNLELGKDRQSTRFRVEFPTLPTLQVQPAQVELVEEKHMHDLLTLTFSTTRPAWVKLLRTGVPVLFSYTQLGVTRVWTGYVSYTSTQDIGQMKQIMQVHCVGNTFGLKDRVNRVFSRTTITEAVKQLLAPYGFKLQVTPHPVVFEQLTVAGHSIWEWINEHAKKIGYGVVVDGMTFTFKPLDELIQSNVSNVPLMSIFGKFVAITNQQMDRTLDKFRVLNGEHIEAAAALRTVKTVGGVNPSTGSIYKSTSSPKSVGKAIRKTVGDVLFSEQRQEHVSHDPATSNALSEGAAQLARLNIPAKASGQGDPNIRVFGPVMIHGTGELTDGIWVVHKAVHYFSANNNYQVDLDLASDGLGTHSTLYAKKSNNKVAGMVDLSEALKNGGKNPLRTNTTATRLKVKTPVHVETRQGWNRSPSKWTYTNAKKR